MPIADDQIALLETVRAALTSLQTSAGGVDCIVREVTVVFPGGSGENPRNVVYRWEDVTEAFTIST